MECEYCGKKTVMPYLCHYCGKRHCSDHKLPENHDCPNVNLVGKPSNTRQRY